MVWRGRSHRDIGRATWRRQAFTLAALLAVFLQAFVVQTHIHSPVAPLAQSYEAEGHGTHDGGSHVDATSQHQRVCAICQAIAANGSAIAPNEVLLTAAGLASEAAIVALTLAPRSHSHSWQSRAPPIRL